jgi:hypothetical protein
VLVRRRVDRDRDESDLPMRDAAFGDDGAREILDRLGFASEHGHFKATVVIEMDVHRRDVKVVPRVLRVGQALRQFARVVVEHIRKGRDAIPRDAPVAALS